MSSLYLFDFADSVSVQNLNIVGHFTLIGFQPPEHWQFNTWLHVWMIQPIYS